jgi:hypothetical protein
VKSKLFTAFPFFLLIFLSFGNKTEIKPARILHQMYDSIRNIKTLRLKISALERIDKSYLSANSEVKLLTHPRKLYFVNRARKIEVLFNSETSGRKALVKANVFPYLTFSLDPTGNIMRKNQHYTIHELGYDFIGQSIAFTLNKDKEGLNNFIYHGKYVKNGYNCYMLEYENKSYTYVDYKVGEKETISLIAVKLCVNDYLLRNRNDLLNDFGYIHKGRILKVPSLYCKRAVIYIDDKLMLPVSISLYDDAGLFESYDYTAIEINKPFLENEFSKDFPGYGF